MSLPVTETTPDAELALAAEVPPAPPPPVGCSFLTFDTRPGNTEATASMTITAVVSLAALTAMQKAASAEMYAAANSTADADPRVVAARERLAKLQAAADTAQRQHAEARTTAERSSAAVREALACGDDPGELEKVRDEATAVRERLGARLGDLSELLQRANVTLANTRMTAHSEARKALRAERQRQWDIATRPLADAFAALVAKLAKIQAEGAAV